MKKKTKVVFSVLALCAVLVAGWLIWGNLTIDTENYDISNTKIPKAFEGFKIVQVSDLHNKLFGSGQEYLLKKVKQADPDIIVVTGDLIDYRHTDIEAAMAFMDGAVKIAPVYYVSGNHERSSGIYGELCERLEKAGVNNCDNKTFTITRAGESIKLCGICDPTFFGIPGDDWEGKITEITNGFELDRDDYNILIFHRPELVRFYNGYDLIFAGHAHGGQVRIPFAGGLIAPDQGYFPKYTSGLYTYGSPDGDEPYREMLVSRGLGNSIIPVRVNNRPEILCAVLHSRGD